MNRIKLPHRLFIILSLFCLFFAGMAFAQEKEGVLLENINLIDGTGSAVQEGMSLYIVGDRVVSIYKYGQEKAPDAAQVFDFTGKYLLPGLIDAHVHFGTNPSGGDNFEDTKKKLAVMLEHGITGVRDMAGDTRYLSFIARQAQLDLIPSPDIYYSALMAGKIFFRDPRTAASAQGETPGETAWMRAVEEGSDFTQIVAQAKGTGATGIKLYADLPAHLCQKVIEEAQAQNFKVWAHATVFPTLPMDLVDAGINSISHAPLLAWQAAETLPKTGAQRYAKTELDPDNADFKLMLEKMNASQTYLDPTIKIYKGRDNLYENAILATKAAYAARVRMVVGTDMSLGHPNVEIFPLIDEMQVLVDEVGMTALEVINAATLNAATLLGIDDEVGSVAVGKKANLVVLDENPLSDITNLDKVLLVIKNGKEVK